MLLSKLKEYADERMHSQLPPLYASTPVAWIVELHSDGRPLTPIPTNLTDPSTPRGRRGRRMAAPEVNRSSAIKPLLLADTGEYTFGRPRDSGKQERAGQAHAAYRQLLDRCAGETKEPAVLAVRRFYERGGVDQLDLGEEWDYGMKITFEVNLADGTRSRPIDLPAVREFWLSINTPDLDDRGQCLVCGDRKPVLNRLQAKITGIRGGQSAGTSIISANRPAFESYGLAASRTAPTCRECGEAFTRAANDLLAEERSHFGVAGATFIFWTRKKDVDFDFGSHLQEPNPAQVKALLDSVAKGRRADIENETAFYATSFSASGGRAVMRDWIDTTVGSVAESLARWFALQRIGEPRGEDPTGENPRPLSLFRLAVSTVRTASDLPVTTPRALFKAALQGTPLPTEIAFQAVRRNRAEQGVSRERAALIKLVLLSQEIQEPREDYMVALDTDHPSYAYHCGRLLAVIEDVQRAALPRVNATIVDRFYGAASSTPAIVFGALLRGVQPHLARLERDNPGAYVNLQRRLEEVCARIGDWPTALPLKDQALFSLGYYHQRAHKRAEDISRRAARDGNRLAQEAANSETEKEN